MSRKKVCFVWIYQVIFQLISNKAVLIDSNKLKAGRVISNVFTHHTTPGASSQNNPESPGTAGVAEITEIPPQNKIRERIHTSSSSIQGSNHFHISAGGRVNLQVNRQLQFNRQIGRSIDRQIDRVSKIKALIIIIIIIF